MSMNELLTEFSLTSLLGKFYSCPHLSDVETEAQRIEI
jgi:hypothetical protein